MYTLDLNAPRNVGFANFNYYESGSVHPDRVMEEHDVVYLLEGEWEVFQEGVRYVLHPGDVLFLFAGLHHYGAKPCAPNTRTMFLHISAQDADVCRDAGGAPYAARVAAYSPCAHLPQVKGYFERIIHTFWSNEPNKREKLDFITRLLLLELAASGERDGGTHNAVVDRIIYQFNLNPDRFFTADELAAQFFMSKRSLMYLFKRYTSETIHNYQIDLKLSIAYQLIRNEPDRKFRELAEYLGFYDEFHFSRLFKRKYGFPPKALKSPAPAGRELGAAPGPETDRAQRDKK